MSRKTSIVTSAADGCGKPQSARSAGGSKSLSCGAEGTIRARTGHSAARWGCSLAAAGLTATAVLLVAIPPARANLININGVNSYGPNSPGSPAPTGTAGAVVSGQMQWNNLAGVETTPGTTVSITNLVDTNGALTNIGLSLTTSGGSYTSNLASMNAMLSSYPAEDGTSTATFSGLDPSGNTTYNLYVYNWWGWGAGNDSTSILASGGTPPAPQVNAWVGGETDATTFTNGVNYVLFTGLTPNSSGDIEAQVVTTSGGPAFNGMQLQWTPTPEPQPLWLLTLGGFGLLLLPRRRRHLGAA